MKCSKKLEVNRAFDGCRSEGVPSGRGGTKGAGIKVICVIAGKN